MYKNIFLILFATLMLSGCGQMGPLYLPPPPKPPVPTAVTAHPTPPPPITTTVVGN